MTEFQYSYFSLKGKKLKTPKKSFLHDKINKYLNQAGLAWHRTEIAVLHQQIGLALDRVASWQAINQQVDLGRICNMYQICCSFGMGDELSALQIASEKKRFYDQACCYHRRAGAAIFNKSCNTGFEQQKSISWYEWTRET